MPHRDRHRRTDAERRELHHQPGELEHHLGKTFAKVEHRFLGLAGNLRERDAKNHGERHHLQHVVLGGGLKETFWNDVLDNLRNGLLFGCFHQPRRRRQRDPDSRFHQIDREQTHRQRQRRDDLEVENGFESEPTDRFQIIAMSRDTDDERSENNRRDDALDQPQENIGDDFEMLR